MLQGWLSKQGKKGMGNVKPWRRRWVVIRGDYFYYYNTDRVHIVVTPIPRT